MEYDTYFSQRHFQYAYSKWFEKLEWWVQNHSNRKYAGLEPSRPKSVI